MTVCPRGAAALLALGAIQLLCLPAANAAHRRLASAHKEHSATRTHNGKRRGPKASAAIVGGARVAIGEAPWQVSVQASIPEGTGVLWLRCGGSILDAIHILTAAHCTFDPRTDQPIPAEDFQVSLGTDDLTNAEPGEVTREVTSVRAHPYYSQASARQDDDLAVLTLSEPLAFSSVIKAVAMASLGSSSIEGTVAALTGFGEQVAGTKSDGRLYGLPMTIAYQRECGGEKGEDNAVLLCAKSAAGSACNGDSGSGLILAGNPPALSGVVDDYQVIEHKDCVAGALATFANVAAPEIQDFIDGSESPPKAPRGGGASCTLSGGAVGDTMSCQAGSWSGAPAFVYTFISDSDHHVLQSGPSSSYRFAKANVGDTVLMQLQATNAGGTGIDRTPPSQPIAPEPQAAQRRAVQRGLSLIGAALIKRGHVQLRLRCTASGGCRGRIALSAWPQGHRNGAVTLAAGGFAIPAGTSRPLRLLLKPAGRRLLRRGAARLRAAVTVHQQAPGHPFSRMQSARLRLRR